MGKLETLIAEVLQIAPGIVQDKLAFQDVREWDSIRHVRLMLALESAFGVDIDADLIVELTTVKAIRQFAEKHALPGDE